ncbi:MAG: FtsW/RodA/SpoVE family cell cycle protein [Candidatus Roizmanbacteria bacterium]|nr:FtsW/RodA/SpoVE family cell cycle protein [Candidatus Roizmanbacteria bacterium]
MKDRTFFFAILLSCFGIAIQFVFGKAYALNQSIYVFVGILIYLGINRFVHARVLFSYIHIISIIGLITLASLLLFGTPIRGSRRWFSIFNRGFQPSIFFTPFFTLSLARIVNSGPIRSLKTFLLIFFLIMIPVLLVFKQPDLGTSLLIFITLSWMYLYSGVPTRYIMGALLLIIPIAFTAPFLLHNYQLNRIISFLNPHFDPYGINYNSLQALIAIGSGGFMGKGLLNASQSQLQFLPEAHTDFVFASFIETFGFIGGLLLLTVITAFMYSLLKDTQHNKNRTALIYAVGLCMFVFIQYAFNIGMNLRLFPVVGVPLPFISAGGTAIVTLFISLALLKKIKDI